MSETLYYTALLHIPKPIIIRIHEHRFINPFKDASEEFKGTLWKDAPEIVDFSFGGRYGRQFLSSDEITSFLNAYYNIFTSRNIDLKHSDPILYISSFLEEDDEQQSHDRNRFNRLLESARFLLDFIFNCSSHVRMMMKNQAYKQVYDQYTGEYFFAKKELVETMEHEDLIVYIPPEDRADDVVKYHRIRILGRDLSVPDDMIVNIASDRILRNFEGEVILRIDLPPRFVREMLQYTIGTMVDDHKENNTEFYKELSKEIQDERELKRICKQYKKRAYSLPRATVKIAIMISDYLKENKLLATKADISKFLFEFFALLHVLRLKSEESLPANYSELIPFYTKRGVSGETIRMMMKDAGEI